MLNFTVRLFKRKDSKWGAIQRSTGKWNGMVGNILNGDADLIATSLTIFGSRIQVLDFMYPLSDVTLGFAIKSKFENKLHYDFLQDSYLTIIRNTMQLLLQTRVNSITIAIMD